MSQSVAKLRKVPHTKRLTSGHIFAKIYLCFKRGGVCTEAVAKFEKVSKAQYEKDIGEGGSGSYDSIRLPLRATEYSAGYDFFAPCDIFLPAQGSAVVKTGVRALIKPGWALLIYPRSGLGFRLGLRLANTVGIIDGDYSLAENEGHIMVKLVNPGKASVTLQAGTAFAQGVFTPFGVAEGDCQTARRTGGFGSTSGK